MKSDSLTILRDNGIRTPKFIVIEDSDKIDLSFSNAENFAVRSSSRREDSKDLSFAGMFSTYLDVKRNDVPERVWALFKEYKEDVPAYGKIMSRDAGKQDTVIVQEMIYPDCSGVMFTANPLGLLNETVIMVGNGLGSNVVDQKVPVTTYYYNTTDSKSYYTVRNGSPVLSEGIVKELVGISEKIKNIFRYECDIEFCVKNNEIYILQAREITTLNGSAAKTILDGSNISESYPGITLPLTQDFVKAVYRDIMGSLVKRMTHSERLAASLDLNMVDFVNSRAYYDISRWYTLLSLLPFSKRIIPVWQEMLGVDEKQITKDTVKVNPIRRLAIALTFTWYFIVNPFSMERLNSKFGKAIESYRKQIAATGDIEGLLKLYRKIQKEITEYWDLTLVNDLYAFVFAHFAKKHEGKIREIGELASMEPLVLLSRLKKAYEEYGETAPAYKRLKNEYIEKYGDRCPGELKLETKTYRTNPDLLDRYIQDNDIPEPRRIQKKKFERIMVVRHAKIGILDREASRLNRTVIYGLIREIFRKIGTTLCDGNLIDAPEDVFYLHIDEINNRNNFRAVVSERKNICSEYRNIPAFSRYIFSGNVFSKSDFGETGGGSFSHSGILKGEVVSKPCRSITGKVLVMTEPDSSTHHKDRIIVTGMTDPGWAFILQNAKGVIAEKGSFLSHTAIISRELQIPSIVNVKNATSVLKTGDTVEMDMEAGMIRILSKEGK